MSNGDVICWKYFWPRLCTFFGAKSAPDSAFDVKWPDYGSCHLEVSSVEFAGRKESRETWHRLCERTGCESAKKTFDWCDPQ